MSLLADGFATANREKLLYAAKTHITGEGGFRSFDMPGAGTNTERLFAAGWSACFQSAMTVVAREKKIRLPTDTAIEVEVDLNQHQADNTYSLHACIIVSLPGVDRELALAIVNEAHQACPYSQATRGNVDTALYLV